MKIAIVSHPTLGGSGIIASRLAQALAERGHEVHYIAFDLPFILSLPCPHLTLHKVDALPYDLLKTSGMVLPLAQKIANLATLYHLDIVHVHYAVPYATAAFLAQKLSKSPFKVVTTLHGTDITLVGRDPSYFDIVKFSIEESDGLTAVSKSLRDDTVNCFSIQKPIEVIYNFFSPKEPLLHRPKHPLFGKKKVLLHASNFRPIKRPHDLLDIFFKVHEKIPSILLLLGTGPLLDSLKEHVDKLALNGDVKFLENIPHVDSYIAASDLFLLPSEQESFGLAALESLSYGIPVVGSAVGGLKEVVVDGVCGYLRPVGETQAMAEAALALLQDESLYKTFSENGKARAHDLFNEDKIVREYLAFYERILSSQP